MARHVMNVAGFDIPPHTIRAFQAVDRSLCGLGATLILRCVDAGYLVLHYKMNQHDGEGSRVRYSVVRLPMR